MISFIADRTIAYRTCIHWAMDHEVALCNGVVPVVVRRFVRPWVAFALFCGVVLRVGMVVAMQYHRILIFGPVSIVIIAPSLRVFIRPAIIVVITLIITLSS